jgi:hypothetical protein
MSALAAARKATLQIGDDGLPELISVRVKASTIIYKGALVALSAGYLVPASAAAGLRCIGRADESVDNSAGADGALRCQVRPGVFLFDNATAGNAIAAAQVGTSCYVVDDHTVSKTPGPAIAGVVVDIESDGQIAVLVGIGPTFAEFDSPLVQKGVATLVAGTVTVTGVMLRATSRIMFSRNTSGGTAGHLAAPSASRDTVAGSFVISSSSGTETSTVDYEILY